MDLRLATSQTPDLLYVYGVRAGVVGVQSCSIVNVRYSFKNLHHCIRVRFLRWSSAIDIIPGSRRTVAASYLKVKLSSGYGNS